MIVACNTGREYGVTADIDGLTGLRRWAAQRQTTLSAAQTERRNSLKDSVEAKSKGDEVGEAGSSTSR